MVSRWAANGVSADSRVLLMISVVSRPGLGRVVLVCLAGVLRYVAGVCRRPQLGERLSPPDKSSLSVSWGFSLEFCSRMLYQRKCSSQSTTTFFRSKSMNQIQFFDPEHRSPGGVSGAHLARYLRPTAAAEKRQQSARSPFDPIFPFRLSVRPVSFRPVASVARPVRSQNDCQDPSERSSHDHVWYAEHTEAPKWRSHVPSTKILFSRDMSLREKRMKRPVCTNTVSAANPDWYSCEKLLCCGVAKANA